MFLQWFGRAESTISTYIHPHFPDHILLSINHFIPTFRLFFIFESKFRVFLIFALFASLGTVVFRIWVADRIVRVKVVQITIDRLCLGDGTLRARVTAKLRRAFHRALMGECRLEFLGRRFVFGYAVFWRNGLLDFYLENFWPKRCILI